MDRINIQVKIRIDSHTALLGWCISGGVIRSLKQQTAQLDEKKIRRERHERDFANELGIDPIRSV